MMFEDKLKEILKESFEADTVMQDAFELNQKKALLSIKQAIAEMLPKEKKHLLEAPIDTPEEHARHIGETDGYNQAISDIRKNLGLG